MTKPPIPEEVNQLLRRLRLPYIRQNAPEVVATAKSQRWDPAEVLRVLLQHEAEGRDAATRSMRRKAAGFPSGKTFDVWREADSSMSPKASLRGWRKHLPARGWCLLVDPFLPPGLMSVEQENY